MIKKLFFGLLFLPAVVFSVYSQDSVAVLNIRQCLDIAIKNNLMVRRSLLQKENVRIGLTQARASRLPTANVSGGYNINFGRSIDPTTNQFIARQINAMGVSGSSNITLFNGLSITNSIRQSRVDLEAAGFDVEKARNDISLNIVNFYLNVIFNKELVENAKYQLESSRQQLERTKILVASGALPRTSELELVSQVASNEVNLVNAQNSLDMALLSLKQAMLIPSSLKIELIVPELDVEQADLSVSVDEVYALALENQPEIISADLQVESAQIGVKIAQGGYYPTVSAGAGFSTNYSDAADRARQVYDGTTVETVPVGYLQSDPAETVVAQVEVPNVVGEDPNYTLSEQFETNLSKYLQLGISVPIFNGLRTKSDVQRSKIALHQAELNAIEQRNLLRQTIETAYNDALAASKTYTASLRQVEALEETFRSIENQYNLGAANFTEYQVASNNLFQAKSDLARAKYDFIFKKKLVDFYQGKPLEF